MSDKSILVAFGDVDRNNDVVVVLYDATDYIGQIQVPLGLVVALMQAGARAALKVSSQEQDSVLPSMESVVRVSNGEKM